MTYDPGAELLIRLQEWLTLEELQRTMRLYDREWTPARTVVELSRLEQQGRVERTGEPPRFRRVDLMRSLKESLVEIRGAQRGNATGLEADLLLAVHRAFGDGWALEVRRRFTEPGAIAIVTRSEPRAAGEDIAGDFVQFVVGADAEALEPGTRLGYLVVLAEHAKKQMEEAHRGE